jgi:hypothetical protein
MKYNLELFEKEDDLNIDVIISSGKILMLSYMSWMAG